MDIEKIKFKEEHIERKFKSSRDLTTIFKAMKNVSYQQNFEIGMVIVCRNIKTDKLVKNKAGIPQKYIIANKLADVLCLCRRIGVNGQLGKGIEIIADYDPEHYLFEEDPDVADAIILDIDYDPLGMPRKIGRARQRAKKYNSEITLKKYFKEKINSTDNSKVAAFIEDMILLSMTSSWKVWRLNDDNNKVMVKIYEVNNNNNEIEIWAIVNGIKEKIKVWNLSSDWGLKYYIEEPKTIEEELEKDK